MPILAREPDLFPGDLLERECRHGGDSARWWVIYTLSRHEKDLMRRLWAMRIPFYGPLVRRRIHSPSGRARVSYVPLFPGYVFLFGAQEHRYIAMTTNCVSRCLDVTDQHQLTCDLARIRQLVDADAPLTPEARLAAGDPVRVKSGPMRGLEGTVVRRRGQERLLVTVTFLQQGASVLIEDYQLEPI